jgi:hypothetical protein
VNDPEATEIIAHATGIDTVPPTQTEPETVTTTTTTGENKRGYIVLRVDSDRESAATGPGSFPHLSVWNTSDHEHNPDPVLAHNGEQAIRLLLEKFGPSRDTEDAVWVAIPTRNFKPVRRTSKTQVVESYEPLDSF